jgi:chromosome segregation ATPase
MHLELTDYVLIGVIIILIIMIFDCRTDDTNKTVENFDPNTASVQELRLRIAELEQQIKPSMEERELIKATRNTSKDQDQLELSRQIRTITDRIQPQINEIRSLNRKILEVASVQELRLRIAELTQQIAPSMEERELIKATRNTSRDQDPIESARQIKTITDRIQPQINEIRSLNRKISEKLDAISNGSNRLNTYKQEVAQHQQAIKPFVEKRSEYRKLYKQSTYKEKRDMLNNAIKRINRQIGWKENRIYLLNIKINKLEIAQEIAQLQQQVNVLKPQIQEQIIPLQRQLESLRQEHLNPIEQQIKSIREPLSSLERQISSLTERQRALEK